MNKTRVQWVKTPGGGGQIPMKTGVLVEYHWRWRIAQLSTFHHPPILFPTPRTVLHPTPWYPATYGPTVLRPGTRFTIHKRAHTSTIINSPREQRYWQGSGGGGGTSSLEKRKWQWRGLGNLPVVMTWTGSMKQNGSSGSSYVVVVVVVVVM